MQKQDIDQLDIPKFKPTVLSPDAVKANIKAMNPFLNDKKINQIFNKVIHYKNWDLK